MRTLGMFFGIIYFIVGLMLTITGLVCGIVGAPKDALGIHAAIFPYVGVFFITTAYFISRFVDGN